jgi:serine/threonine protein kinase
MDLQELNIPWKGPLTGWKRIGRFLLPQVGLNCIIKDYNQNHIASIKPIGNIGEGTFGIVDEYERKSREGEIRRVAVKRPRHPNIDLFLEGLFQWHLWHELKEFGISFCVPRVFDIFRYQPTGDVWFSMECFEPLLLSKWLVGQAPKSSQILLPLLLLQIALVLEVMENHIRIDHRDLKINNMIIVEEDLDIEIKWDGRMRKLHFPFRIVFVDFGFACLEAKMDIREGNGLPPLDFCPKEGRDLFQVLASLWSISTLRRIWEQVWGNWVLDKIDSAVKPEKLNILSYMNLIKSAPNLDWMYNATDDKEFRAPKCAPSIIIRECLDFLESH